MPETPTQPRVTPEAKGLAGAGYRVVRIRTESRCKCCDGRFRDTVERWLLLRKLNQLESDGSRVSLAWMVEQSQQRLGERISDSSYKNHAKNHIEIIRDLTIAQPELTRTEAVREAQKEIASRDQAKAADEGYEAGSHQRFLEEVVKMGRAKIEAEPESVTVDHALSAAKELARLKQDESRAELVRALAAASGVRVGPPQVQRELDEPVEVEATEVVEA